MNIPQFLGQHDIPFEVLQHPQAFDAQHLAQAVHVSGHHVAKTVLLRADKSDYVVAVLPATHYVNLDKTREALQAQTVELASEIEMAERCPDCEVGTLPPFGSQYEMRTIVDSLLTADEEMIFEGNTHSEAIRMKSRDFLAVEKPLIAPIS